MRAITENHTHYLPTTGLPRLRQLAAQKLRDKNHVPVERDDEVIVTNGGIHGLSPPSRAARAGRRGDPPRSPVAADDGDYPVGRRRAGAGAAARVAGVPLGPGRARTGDHAEDQVLYLELAQQPERRQPTRADLERLAAIARDRNCGSCPTKPTRTCSSTPSTSASPRCPECTSARFRCYTLSKSYAMTGVRVGYFAMKDAGDAGPGDQARALHRQQRQSIAQ